VESVPLSVSPALVTYHGVTRGEGGAVMRWDEKLLEQDKPWSDEVVRAARHKVLFEDRRIAEVVANYDIRYLTYNYRDEATIRRVVEAFFGNTLWKDPEGRVLDPRKQVHQRKLLAQRPGMLMSRYSLSLFMTRDMREAPLLGQVRPFKMTDLGLALPEGIEEDEGVVVDAEQHTHAYYEHRHGKKPSPRYGRRGHAREAVKRERGADDETGIDRHVREAHGGDLNDPSVTDPARKHKHPWSRQSREAHERKRHGGKVVWDEHYHAHRAKYLYPPKPLRAARLDIHPLAWPLLEAGGPVVYFVMEGILKNDSVLSVGIDEGGQGGTPVVNCGSVTLWDDPDLAAFTRTYLSRFDTVVVVPDSDWATTPEEGARILGNFRVEQEAFDLSRVLERYGAKHTVVAAPPATCADGWCEHFERFAGEVDGKEWWLPHAKHKQGVDDYLAAGGDLGGTWAVPRPVVVEDPPLAGDVRRQARDGTYLRYLRETSTGRVMKSLRRMERTLGMGRNSAKRALLSLDDQGYGTYLPDEYQQVVEPGDTYKRQAAFVLRPDLVVPRTAPVRLHDYLQRMTT
jgi:hypothetical protein